MAGHNCGWRARPDSAQHEPDDALHWMNLGGILLQVHQSDESMREGLSYLDRALQQRIQRDPEFWREFA